MRDGEQRPLVLLALLVEPDQVASVEALGVTVYRTGSTQREAVAKYLYERVMADRGEPKAGWENCPGQFVEDWLAQADVLIAIVKESE